MRIGGANSPFSVSKPTKIAAPVDERFVSTSPLSAAALKVSYSVISAQRNIVPFKVFLIGGKKRTDSQLRSARQRLEEELADNSAHGGDDNEDNFQDVSFDARATLPASIREEEARDPFIRVATCILKDLSMPKDIDDFLVEDCRKEFFSVKEGHYEII